MIELPEDVREKARRGPLPEWIAPMLATLTDRRFDDPGWIYEWKLDGERCLARVDHGDVELWSRARKRSDGSYPEIADAVRALDVSNVWLDGEVVVLTPDGRTDFEALQHRIQIDDLARARATGIPVTYFVFDVMYVDGHDLRPVALEHRKEVLASVVSEGQDAASTLRRVEPVRERGMEYYREACRRGWEGVIAKDLGSPYVAKRSKAWLKFKCVLEQEFVVGGFTEPKGSRVGIGALLVGYYDEAGRLRYAGKVGTGYDTETLLELRRRLDPLQRADPPFADERGLPRKGVHWVEPKLVVEVGFGEWTDQGRLRHPRFLGIRRDKDPRPVVRETSA